MIFLMRHHGISGDVRRISRNVEAMELDAIWHVIVLPSPTPEFIAESIHRLELARRHCTYAPENVVVRQPDEESSYLHLLPSLEMRVYLRCYGACRKRRLSPDKRHWPRKRLSESSFSARDNYSIRTFSLLFFFLGDDVYQHQNWKYGFAFNDKPSLKKKLLDFYTLAIYYLILIIQYAITQWELNLM